MAIFLYVKWVRQSEQTNPYQRIVCIGGSSGQIEWEHTHEQVIDAIEHDVFRYFVKVGAHNFQLEIALAPDDSKYVKTQADTDRPLLLLALPRIPKPAKT